MAIPEAVATGQTGQSSRQSSDTICLHVVSPGVENKHTFPSLPLTTTVGELKRLIEESTASKPPPERQRLIYRGRRLAVDGDSLRTVFGEVDSINGPKTFTIHLVLPFPASHQSPNSVNAPMNPQVTALRAPSQEPPPFASTTRSNSPSTTNGVTTPTGSGASVPTHLQNVMSTAMAAHQEAVRQAFSQHLQQPPHASATNGPDRPPTVAEQNHPALTTPLHIQQRPIAASPSQNQDRPPTSRNIQTSIVYSSSIHDRNIASAVIRSETRMIMSQSPTIPGFHSQAPAAQPQTQIMDNPNIATVNRLGFQPNDIIVDPVADDSPQRSRFREAVQAIQLRLTVMEREARTIPRIPWQTPSEQEVQQLLTELEQVCQSFGVPPDDVLASDVSRRIHALPRGPPRPSTQQIAQALRSGFGTSRLPTLPANNSPRPDPQNVAPLASGIASNSQTPSALPSANDNMTIRNPTVYLLSSPSGPYALVFPPNGTYSTTLQTANRTRDRVLNTFNRSSSGGDNMRRNRERGDVLMRRSLERLQAHRNDRLRRNFLRSILRSVWLILRLALFVWFFGLGGSRTRIIVSLIGSLIVLLVHAGVFAPLRNPLREHLDALVPFVADNGRPAANQEPRQDGSLARPTGPLQENWMRSSLRRAERALTLFMATLIPGVGERHIQARTAAEAARIAQERQREEESRSESQPSNQEGAGAINASNSNGTQEDVGGENRGSDLADLPDEDQNSTHNAPPVEDESH